MSETIRELDVRNLPSDQGMSDTFLEFDALATGEAFVLISDREPRAVLLQFQEQRAGNFEWSVLEAGPARFRVEIRRREGEPTRTVSDYLEFDHRRLDGMLPEVARLVRASQFEGAARQFAEFSCGLNRHIDAEERILFPSFERLTGMIGGPTVVMRAEHVEIRREMETITAALDAADDSTFTTALHRLTSVLSEHNMKEEHILYPMTDETAGVSERDALVRQMQAL